MMRGGAVALIAPPPTSSGWLSSSLHVPLLPVGLVSSPPSFEYLCYVIAIYALLALECAEELFSRVSSIKARAYQGKVIIQS